MSYIGDFSTGATIDHKFTTIASSGKAKTLTSAAPKCWKSNSTVPSTVGITLTADFAATTGLNHLRVTTTNAFYAGGNDYVLALSTGTVNSISVRGYVVGEFSIRNRSALRPTVAGRTIDISTDFRASANVLEIKSSTANADKLAANVVAYTTAKSAFLDALISSRLPTTNAKIVALTTGRIVKLDNVDVIVSSRYSSTAVVSANVTKIKGTSANTDNLVTRVDATISSRMSSTKSVMSSTKSVLGSTAVANANLVKVKGSSATADNWVTRLDGAISSRMSSTKSVLGSTAVAYADIKRIKGSSGNTDNLVTRIDATISSRMSSTASITANLAKVKGSSATVDNWVARIDTTISSRMSSTATLNPSTGVVTANVVKIKGTTGNVDNLVARIDATISSRLPTTNAKIVALTTDRIDNLDYLNAQITSRLASTGLATANITKIKGSTSNADNLVTRVDAAISSRMSSTKSVLGSTAVAYANVTKIKSSTANADNLVTRVDATISSRMSSTKSVLGSTALANANITKIKGSSGNADNLVTRVDAAISSRLPTTHAKVVALTTDRIDNLDNLNAQISSRMSSTAVPSVSLTKLEGSTANADKLTTIASGYSTGEASSLGGSWSNKIDLLYSRFYRKVTQTSSTQKVFKADGLTVIGKMTVSATTVLQTKGAATT